MRGSPPNSFSYVSFENLFNIYLIDSLCHIFMLIISLCFGQCKIYMHLCNTLCNNYTCEG